MNSGQRMPAVAAHDLVGDDRADDGHDDADHDLGDPIFHNCGILMIGGGIWTWRPLEAKARCRS